MTDRRATLLGLGWGEVLATRPERTPGGGAQAVLARSDSHRTSAAWWPGGAANELAVREGAEVWVHVLAGELSLERWARDDEGGWHVELGAAPGARALAGESLRLEGGALHRMTARRTTNVLLVCSPPDALEAPIDRPLLRMVRRAREVASSESVTSVGFAAPAGDGEADA